MGNRYRKPESLRIVLEGGDWLEVKKHLTAGESRHAQAKVLKPTSPGETPIFDLEHLGIAQAVAYLLDWNITDESDRPVRIADQPYDVVAAALKNQSPESLREILAAIEAHDTAMVAERNHEKKVPAGATVPDPTSTSVG